MRKATSTRCSERGRFVRCVRRGGGFTLLEVLAALILVAVVLPVAMRGLSLATQGGSYARSVTVATDLAKSKLAEVVADGSWDTGDDRGVFDAAWGDDADRFEWTLAVSDWLGTTMKEVRITVSWEQRNALQSVSIATVVMEEGV